MPDCPLERVVAAIIMAGVSQTAHADLDCVRWAQLVERIEAIKPEDREAHYAMWRAYAAENKVAKMYVLSAINWVRSGSTSKAAWLECDNY